MEGLINIIMRLLFLFALLLSAILIIGKAAGSYDISWWIATAPLWIYLGLELALVAIIFAIAIIASR